MAAPVNSVALMQNRPMTEKSFVETYKIDHALCDRLVDFYNKNKRYAQPGRLGRYITRPPITTKRQCR